MWNVGRTPSPRPARQITQQYLPNLGGGQALWDHYVYHQGVLATSVSVLGRASSRSMVFSTSPHVILPWIVPRVYRESMTTGVGDI